MKKIILSTFLLGTFLSADAQRELKWVTILDSINTNVDVLNESNNTREFLQLDIKNNQLGIFATSNNNPFNASVNASDGKVNYENVKSASETIAGICFDKQGNLYSLYSPGWSGWGTANYDSYLRKLNKSGQIVFNNTVNNYTVDFLRQIMSSVDSGLFLYGINRNGSNGYLSHSIYKINPSGSVAFSNTISDLDWYAGSPGKFALDKSGIVFSAKRQTSQYNENTYDIVLRKVDNKGTQLWQVYYDYNSLCDYIEDLKIDKNGDVYITTNSHTAPNWGTSTRRIVKINGSNGNKIYERKIGGTAGRNDIKIINNNLYVAVGSDSILCMNPATGKTNWKLGLGTTYNYRSFYIDKNDKLYVVGANGVKRYSSIGVLDDSFRVKNTTYTFNHYGIQIDTLDNLYLYGEKVKGSGSKIFIAKFGCKNRNSFLGVDKKVCGKDSIQISASNGMKSYSWNNSAITKSIFVKSSENFICTQTDSSDCLSRDTISVSVINGKISPRDTIVCSGTPVNLTLKGTSSGPITQKWSTGDTTTSIKYSTTGTNKVWVKVSDGIGACYDTTTLQISNPKVDFASDTLKFASCKRDSLRVGVGNKWNEILWSNGGKDSFTYLKTTGKYKVRVKDDVGCYAYDSTNFVNPGRTKANFVAVDSVNCFGGSDGFVIGSASGGFVPITYLWNDSKKQTTSKATGLTMGSYKLVVKDLYGCKDSFTSNVNEPAKVSLTITAIDSVNCFQGSDGSITTSIAGGSKGYKYVWNDPSKQITTKASSLKKGVYKLIAKDLYGCLDSITGTIDEPAKVVISITNIDSAFCYGYSDGAIATSTKGGKGTYNWNWNTSPIQTTPKSIGLKKGNYKVIVKDVYGCSDSIMGTVNEPEQIVPKITVNRLTMVGMTHELYADITPVKKYQYLWTPLSTFNGLNIQPRPRIIFNETTKVGLMVTDYKGCKGYDTATLTVVQPIKNIIPTGFTPNADNLNEGFGLPDIFEIQSLEIYDRWGGVIFKGSSTTPRWDGRLNGELVPSGVYAYTLQAQLKGTDQIVKHGGSITLIK